ncbi:translesion error-prone DNA polymerase V autoproteolytic subunit [Salegentibacter sp. LM13S]|uniref:LexA family protein n=1 Tax=Salegentibacter lacus TaxID=2873599 RepID=UPI001CCA2295|nr:translesion error-prone DNA polymerase V autoproteolytic subunit [Salegentibacter lacus]MBZ9632191.1 translesion error-prone DNA polymerase V autoproteolytic subunit [Salegentibacter lacus]
MKIYEKYSLHNLVFPISSNGISAGFPSPADDHLEDLIDLNQQLIKNKEATFFGRAEGDSMIGAGIGNGDLLVIDKSLRPKNQNIAVCFLDGEFTVKRIKIEKDIIWLVAENEKYKPIKVTSENDFVIWGIVTHCIKDL